MGADSHANPRWLVTWMQNRDIGLWGVADLRQFATPRDASGVAFPIAISWAEPMDPEIMADVGQGPNQAYADEYASSSRATWVRGSAWGPFSRTWTCPAGRLWNAALAAAVPVASMPVPPSR